MPRFIACHTMPGVTRAMMEQAGQAAQNEPGIKGVASYSNLSKGVVHCVFDAPNEQNLAAWFQKMKMPYDRIVQVELEGELGKLREL